MQINIDFLDGDFKTPLKYYLYYREQIIDGLITEKLKTLLPEKEIKGIDVDDIGSFTINDDNNINMSLNSRTKDSYGRDMFIIEESLVRDLITDTIKSNVILYQRYVDSNVFRLYNIKNQSFSVVKNDSIFQELIKKFNKIIII